MQDGVSPAYMQASSKVNTSFVAKAANIVAASVFDSSFFVISY
ncbi:hypothetical protein M139_3809 [Bacteroides fragilis str. S23L24]|nr:hypothetical protein M139_3809 [Bacteroides fragilis str. S23L24]